MIHDDSYFFAHNQNNCSVLLLMSLQSFMLLAICFTYSYMSWRPLKGSPEVSSGILIG